MTNKQPDPLSIADELDCHNARLDRQAAKAIRTQHADLLRKDALLRQALETLCCETSENMDDPGHRCGNCDDYVDRNGILRDAIRKELAK